MKYGRPDVWFVLRMPGREGVAEMLDGVLGQARTLRTSLERSTAWAEASDDDAALAQALKAAHALPEMHVRTLADAHRIVIAGAGSSYYIAQAAAAAMRAVCRLPAVAVPLSELLLRPEGVLAPGAASRQPVIVVSRSGTTTEAVAVARQAREAGHPTITVTCRPGSDLARQGGACLAVPEADERAIVMTRSFSGMLTALLGVVGRLAPDASLAADLGRLTALRADLPAQEAHALQLAILAPSRVVVLGGGMTFGIANEAVLKVTETSQVPANAFEPFEFRHGPISVCEPGMVVVGLLIGDSATTEQQVLDECALLGATTWSLGGDGPGSGLHPAARMVLLLRPLQAFALGLALCVGRDPESPRHLSQVVVLPAR